MNTISAKRARKLNLGLLLLLAMAVLAMFWVMFKTIEAEREERRQVALTNGIVVALNDIMRSALQAETGQRGYLITLDPRYLAPFREGQSKLMPSVERLHERLEPVATDRQRELLAEVESSASEKIAELEETVALTERGDLLDARQIVLTNEGRDAMVRLRTAAGELEDIEQEIIKTALAEAAAAQARTLPLLTVLLALVIVLLVFVVRLVARAARVEAEAEQAVALAEARDRADLLAKELNHRVKNLFAVILAIVQMSGRDNPDAKPLVESIASRIRALLTAHEVTQGVLDKPVASLKSLIETTLSPYRSASQPAELSGPDLMIPAKSVTPLGLVLHELTTNAVKYGAWSNGGTVHVDWKVSDDQLRIHWHEDGCEALGEPESQGFGSLLMTGAARQLGGTIDRKFLSGGCDVVIAFPYQLGANSA